MSKDSLLGKQFADYRLEELLGQGGMARVYRGLNTRLQRYEAIKVIDNQFRDDDEYTRRFKLEAQAIAQLSHPHIVTVFQTGHVGDILYMAMDYIDGSDVAHVLESYEANNEFIDPQEALQIIREIGSALDYIHRLGIIHRDVKPANILLDPTGRAILTDFGLALMTNLGTRGEIFGTPHYLSPEQAISSAAVVPQSDIYSLGIIAYRMFTGRLPFNTGEPLDIALQHLNDPVPNPQGFRAELSDAVTNVLFTVLDKDIDQRYHTGQAFADALETAINTTPDITKRTSLPRLSIPEIVQIELEEAPETTPQPPTKDTHPHSASPTAPKALPPKPTITRNPQSGVAPAPRATSTMTAIPEPGLIERYRIPLGIALLILVVIVISAVIFTNRDQLSDKPVADNPTDMPATFEPEVEMVLTDTPAPTSDPNVIPLATPMGLPTATVQVSVIPVQLTASNDILLIHNQSDVQILSLAPFRFTAVSSQIGIGGGFTISGLEPDQCVAYASADVIAYTPTTCNLVETFTITDDNRLVWREAYRVSYQNGYNGAEITICQPNADCIINPIVQE